MTPFSYYALYIFLYIFLYNFLYIFLYIFFSCELGPRILYEKDKVCFPCFFFYSMLIAHQAGLAKVDIYLKGGLNM